MKKPGAKKNIQDKKNKSTNSDESINGEWVKVECESNRLNLPDICDVDLYKDILVISQFTPRTQNKLSFWDAKDPLNIKLLAETTCRVHNHLKRFDNNLYIFAEDEIEVIDISNLKKIKKSVLKFPQADITTGIIVNGRLLFTFKNGIATHQDGQILPLAEIENDRMFYSTMTKRLFYHDYHLFVTALHSGINVFELKQGRLEHVSTLTKGFTPPVSCIDMKLNMLILVGNEDFVCCDITDLKKMRRFPSAKMKQIELCSKIAFNDGTYLAAGLSNNNDDVFLGSFKVTSEGPTLLKKQKLKDYRPKTISSSSIVGLYMIKKNLLIMGKTQELGVFEYRSK